MATILFAEEEYSQPMVDFAAALSARGHRTVRLLADSIDAVEANPSRVRWEGLCSRSVPEAVMSAGPFSDVGMSVLDAESPVDVQAMEPTATWMSYQGLDDRLGVRKAAALPDRDVIDKLALTRFLHSRDVAVPLTWDRVEDVPRDTTGPLLFKLRDSGGGRGVHRCRTLSELREWVIHYGEATPYLVQEFFPGAASIGAGVAREGAIVQAMTYTNRLDPQRPFAFGYGLTVTDDPDVMDRMTTMIETVGLSGPFAVDFVRDGDGVPRIVDVNIRVWGSWTACQAAGLDVLGSYEFSRGLGPRPPAPLLVPGSYHSALRTPPLDVAGAAPRARWLRRELRDIRSRQPWLGRPWVALARRRAVGWAVKGRVLHTADA